jgi:HK97 family phage major capsid protein
MGFGVGQQTIERGKLAAIIPFTMELLEANLVTDLEAELRTAMVEAAAIRLDNAFFSNLAAVTRIHPAGILNGVTVSAGVTGGGVDAVSSDVQNMYNELVAARVGAKPVLVVSTQDRMKVAFMRTAFGDLAFRDELGAGTLLGIPVISSQTLPAHTAIMVDVAYLGFGLGMPMFKYSEEATIVGANADATAPTMAGTAGAAPGAAPQGAGQVAVNAGIMVSDAAAANVVARSLYQTYSAALRLTQYASWGILAPGAVAARNTLTW